MPNPAVTLKYFPFEHDTYTLTMNARAGIGPLIEVDEQSYLPELSLKASILASDPRYYCQCPPDAEPLAWEVLALLLPDMAASTPEHFRLARERDTWTWTNRLRDETIAFTPGDPAGLGMPALEWLGRQVQEDLILMADRPDGGLVCAGGCLCFAANWCLDDKIGKSLLGVHAEVPEFAERIGRPSELMLRRLKPGRPTGRLNWGVVTTDHLNMAPAAIAEWGPSRNEITPENAGERCRLRVERQTFSRLPESGGVLFTIRTYVDTISDLVSEPDRLRRFRSVLKSVPPATLEYKGMSPFVGALIAYLEAL